MAQYMILIYDDEQAMDAADEAVVGKTMAGHLEFRQRNGAAVLDGHRLHRTTTATSIRGTDDGDYSVTDGPFAETKEALCGLYVVEAADLDAAIAMAKQVPAPFGGVEVRPIWAMD